MYCANIEEAFQQIGMYFAGKSTGYPLLIDTENIGIYNEIRERLEADKSKQCKYVSESCQKNGLPNLDVCVVEITDKNDYILIGSSQALMLKSESDLEHYIDKMLGLSISGHALILLHRCRGYIEKYENRDLRMKNRTIIIKGEVSPLPKIVLTKETTFQSDFMMESIQQLLAYLEKMSERQLQQHNNIMVKTNFSKKFFSQAVYQVSEADGVYETLVKQYSELAGATEKLFATESQWKWLLEKLEKKKTFSAVILEELGTISNFEYLIQDISDQKSKNQYWLLWLAMKVYGTNNKYLKRVLGISKNEKDFEKHIYLLLAEESYNDSEFESLYLERRKLLGRIPENLPLVAKYCEKVGRYEKNAVYYLTDQNENEKFEFIKYLCIYDYSEEELYKIIKHFSSVLDLYLHPFIFDKTNTKVAAVDSTLCDMLSQYFQEYKIQKLTNRIYPYFMDMVKEFAVERPYNKLRPRSTVISQLDKEGSEVFFFDALGVEYLSFIKAKCEEYGLLLEISVAHGELPSITEKNKEFLWYFEGKYRKIDELDQIKHHSQIYDYEKRKEPIHIFKELEIIDTELRKIQSLLVQEVMDKAIIVSDHGASRLAVICEQENSSGIELEEKGKHSGRCCPVEKDPNIAYAAYEDGFAVLANYERFKGGRKANVEVHGGASLEEVIVPVITLYRKPEQVEYCFTESLIKLKQKDVATLTLYCNVAMNHPRILVGNKFYEGEFIKDQKHAKFIMSDLKRSKEYVAKVYEGDTDMAVVLNFRIQKTMSQEIDLFS